MFLRNFSLSQVFIMKVRNLTQMKGIDYVTESNTYRAFYLSTPPSEKNWFLPWSGFEPTSPWLLLSLNVFPSYFFSIKIKLPKKTFVACYGNILNKGNKIVSRLELSSWPCERKLNLKLSIFQPNRTSASAIENTITHAVFLPVLTLNFSRMIGDLIEG